MTIEQKFYEAKTIIQEWVSKQGHDRCWYYPDLFRKLAEIFEVQYSDPGLPPRNEFEKGCEKYQEEEYKKRH
ncbi:hypothetical protein J4221_00680 [Candidatus Pacearchaeota archaeon]|nr:hypothetical protein [Candidatus Pacearchaeota archaeon]